MRARIHGEPTQRSGAAGIQAAEGNRPVGFMFPGLLSDPGNLLPQGAQTIAALQALGAAMAAENDADQSGDSNIPAPYTYFGQFIDHDITKTEFSDRINPEKLKDVILSEDLKPIAPGEVGALVLNRRSLHLDLDSVFGGTVLADASDKDGKLKLAVVTTNNVPGIIPTNDPFHDLFRLKPIDSPQSEEEELLDRQAVIGDPRNDENLLVAQLHVAFVRAHNALVDRFKDADRAQVELRRRYQWAVVDDFLKRVCDKDIVNGLMKGELEPAWKIGKADDLFMPLEFSGAAYRFGHSMIRGEYDYNATFNPHPGALARAKFNFMFTFTALSGDLQPGAGDDTENPTLPANWIADWPRLFDLGANPARRIDTKLTPELGTLRDASGIAIVNLLGRLAARNLLRGYLLGLPTGQAVARHLGIQPLSRAELLDAIPPDQRRVVDEAGLIERSPLWFYVLAEAGVRGNGNHLGPVGSRIVAETLINSCRFSKDSVVAQPPTEAELASGEFSLRGIVRLGLDRVFDLPPE